MAPLEAEAGIRLRVSWGSRSTPGGKSHSWVTPTRSPPRPRAQTSSVREGSRLTMRMGIDRARPPLGFGEESRDGQDDLREREGASVLPRPQDRAAAVAIAPRVPAYLEAT